MLIICSYQNYEVTVCVKFSVNKKIQLHCEGGLYENTHHQNIDLQANIELWVKINGSYMENGVISVEFDFFKNVARVWRKQGTYILTFSCH